MSIKRIVVGVDGSDNSRAALKWAISEAAVHGAKLEVVHSWDIPVLFGTYSTPSAAYDPQTFEEAAQAVLDEVVASSDQHALQQPIEKILAEGQAAAMILETAKGADLLVVGQRGRGGFTGLLLGSISHQVVHHATCPVVVYPAE